MITKSLLSVLLTMSISHIAIAQGCSDAGFCTVGGLGHQKDSVARNVLSLIMATGNGEQGVFVFTPGVQYERRLSSLFTIQAKVTANYAGGDLGNAFGAGDLYLSAITNPFENRSRSFAASFTAGVKLPLADGDMRKEGLGLPMPYQSSLGTTDVITGVTLSDGTWQFSLGWQQPLTKANENSFDPDQWSVSEAFDYFPSYMLKRRADVLLRGVFGGNISRKLSGSGGLLAIYHVGEDEYRDSEMNYVRLKGSDGLTLNVTGTFDWKVNASFTVGLTMGFPVVVRDVRPDGLTRSIVVAPEVRWAF